MPLSDPGELERLRGAAALKSIGDSPNASRLLAGKGRSQRSNEIVSKSIERSGLNRDQLVSAAKNDRPRYDRMVSNASRTNAEREAIAQRAGTALGQGLAGRVKTEAPKSETQKPAMDPFAAGGGNAKMRATGMTRDQVIALGNKNLKNQKPNTNTNTSTAQTQTPTRTAQDQAQSQQVRRTQVQQTSANKTSGLTPEQIKQYNRAWSNKDNFLARGTIRGHYNKLTPEQQKAFRAHAQSQGHNWGNYFECYFDAVDSGRIIITEAILGSIIKAAARQSLKNKALQKTVAKSFDKGAKMAIPTGKVKLPGKIKMQTPTKNITGFRTGGHNRGANFDPMKGSKYQFTPGTATTPPKSTPFTAPGHHTTPAGRKPTTDMTAFTSRKNAGLLRQQRIDNRDWTTGERLKGKDDWKSYTNPQTGRKERIPVSGRPEKGLIPVEVWDNYPKGVEYKHGVFSKGGERMTHAGSPIVDIQTKKGGSNLSLYGQQRREIQQRVKAALRKKQNVDVLKKELKQGNEASIKDLYRRRNNPSNPNTLENELRGRYRGKGAGRRERI